MIENIGLYRFFYEAARQGSISAAAKALFVTQPAVSNAIMQLENRLSVKLFYRVSRGIRLTPEGELLFSHIEKAFDQLEAGEDGLREIRGLAGGLMRIGASDMTLRFYLLDHIERFREEYPLIRLSVTNAPTPQSLEALRNGKIDFAVISSPVGEDSDLEIIPVRKIRDIIIAADRFPIGKDSPVDAAELDDLPLISLERGTSTRKYVDEYLKITRQPDFELATSDLVLEFARRGMGVGCIVEDFALDDLENGRLHEIKLKEPIPPRDFLLVYSRSRPLSAAARKFIDMIVTNAERKKDKTDEND